MNEFLENFKRGLVFMSLVLATIGILLVIPVGLIIFFLEPVSKTGATITALIWIFFIAVMLAGQTAK